MCPSLMGYVPVEFAHNDVDFGIEIVGERRAARLIDDCLWDPAGEANAPLSPAHRTFLPRCTRFQGLEDVQLSR